MAAGWCALALILGLDLSERDIPAFANSYNRELAKNGLWSLFAAFRANQLEFDGGYATGKLAKPFVAGATKAEIMRQYAKKHGLDLAESWAYSDSFSDYPMLAVVGHPTAVNPDLRLRSIARSYDWPVLDLDA